MNLNVTFMSATRSAWQLVRKDPIVLVPNIALLLLIHLGILVSEHWIHSPTTALLAKGIVGKLAAVQWLTDLFMNGLLVTMVLLLMASPKVDMRSALNHLLRQLPRLILFTAPIGILFSALLWWSVPTSLVHMEKLPIGQIIGLCGAGFLSLILAILPPAILIDTPSFLDTYRRLILLLRLHFLRVILFSLMAFNVSILVMLTSLIAADVPSVGESVLSIIIQGAGFSFIYITWIEFYRALVRPTVSVIS